MRWSQQCEASDISCRLQCKYLRFMTIEKHENTFMFLQRELSVNIFALELTLTITKQKLYFASGKLVSWEVFLNVNLKWLMRLLTGLNFKVWTDSCQKSNEAFYSSFFSFYSKSFLYLPQEFSSDPSAQSFSPLQKSPRSIQFPSPQAKNPSWHKGSSVIRRGFTLRSLFFNLQFFTAPFQSQVCFSISKNKPAGQRMACRP